MLAYQAVDQTLNSLLAEFQHRVAIALLIAREHEGIEGQRVLLRGRNLLLDQAADDACLIGG